jgi:hypothetical protein
MVTGEMQWRNQEAEYARSTTSEGVWLHLSAPCLCDLRISAARRYAERRLGCGQELPTFASSMRQVHAGTTTRTCRTRLVSVFITP